MSTAPASPYLLGHPVFGSPSSEAVRVGAVEAGAARPRAAAAVVAVLRKWSASSFLSRHWEVLTPLCKERQVQEPSAPPSVSS